MILLITASPTAPDYAAALQKATGESAQLAGSAQRASKIMQGADFAALVIDTSLLEADLDAQDTFWRYTGTAIPVYVNLAVNGVERVVREVQTALKRRAHERQIAIRAARSALRNELKDAVTGILLSSEMALQVPSLPETAVSKIRSLCELAREVRARLNTTT